MVVDRRKGQLFSYLHALPEHFEFGLILRECAELEEINIPLWNPNIEIGLYDEMWVSSSKKDGWILSNAVPGEPCTEHILSLPMAGIISAHWSYTFDDYGKRVYDFRALPK